MQTFENRMSSRGLCLAVVVPPALYWILVASLSFLPLEPTAALPAFLVLVGLAQGLPLAALAWILFSVSACSITTGRLIVHRVVSDRELPLTHLHSPAKIRQGAVLLDFGERKLTVRPAQPEQFLQALDAAMLT